MSLSPLLLWSIFAGVVWGYGVSPGINILSREDFYLGIFATLKEGSDPDQANIVIPHHSVLLVISWYPKRVLEHYNGVVSFGGFLFAKNW